MTVSLSLDPQFFNLLADSHQRLVGTPLIDNGIAPADAARWLYEDAPFCMLAHNTDPDPCFIYANRAAQRCFEYDWNGITALRSRFSAEQPNREERAQLLESVRTRGFATGYRGVRISRSGRRFWIEGGTVWNLIDSEGVYHGQAATFHHWYDV
ncbi:hypothetical protein LMG19083_03744 [Ralstonia psammae]|uniref:MEKHLA domain-containing protein n=1 Tax=Ralstonia psammae TaxID=3058598 RepID=A0ABN9J853_9RALS|nr:MEKHLA domain-containing protein [Ralstonia sp. LMG 19083]CAJ0802554.1 hypothetical protein LMG19083_03744 [Ralstonia sp. LMG 19083]